MSTVCVTLIVWPGGLRAQSGAAMSPADSGDMAFGPRDFTSYTTPGMCEAAALMTLDNVRTTLAAISSYDTLRYRPLQDTTPTAVRRVARSCGARFTLGNTTAADWAALFNLALFAGDDSLARAVLARRVASTSPDSQMELRLDAVQAYLGGNVDGWVAAAPARVGLAEEVVAQIDRASQAALIRGDNPQMEAHYDLLNFGVLTNDEQRVRDQVAAISAIAHRDVTGPWKNGYPLILHKAAYQALMQMAFFRYPDSMRAIARRAQEDLRRFPEAANICPQGGNYDFWNPGCRTAPVDSIVAELNQWRLPPGARGGRLPPAIPPVRAQFWFPKPPLGANPEVPVPGKMTLLVHFTSSCLTDVDALFYKGVCHDVFDHLRYLATRYGPQGLVVAVIAQTDPSVLLSGLETPAKAAERIRWYYQEHAQLPVTVGVQTMPGYADNDWQADTAHFRFGDDDGGGMILTGPQGEWLYELRFGAYYGTDFDVADQMIATALRQH